MKKFILSTAALAAEILPNPVKQAIYKVKPLAGLIRGGLNRAAPTGLTQVRVAAGDLAGYTIRLDMQIDKDYWLGTYEPELQAALRELIQPGAVIYDVGANIGYVSLLLAKAAGESGHVYAFEALPGNVEQWRQNIALNGMKARLSLFAGAVTGFTGPVRFLVHASGGMGKAAGSAGRADQYQSGSAGHAPDPGGGAPAYADGTTRPRIQPRCLGDAARGRLHDLLDATRVPGGPIAGGDGLEGLYCGETRKDQHDPAEEYRGTG